MAEPKAKKLRSAGEAAVTATAASLDVETCAETNIRPLCVDNDSAMAATATSATTTAAGEKSTNSNTGVTLTEEEINDHKETSKQVREEAKQVKEEAKQIRKEAKQIQKKIMKKTEQSTDQQEHITLEQTLSFMLEKYTEIPPLQKGNDPTFPIFKNDASPLKDEDRSAHIIEDGLFVTYDDHLSNFTVNTLLDDKLLSSDLLNRSETGLVCQNERDLGGTCSV